jgi:hypothetical protein
VHRPAGGADGMTVPGQRHPYGDKDLYALAPGEEVISNRHGQADRHRGLLKAINAGHLADGGTAGFSVSDTFARSRGDSVFNVATDISRGLDSVFIPWSRILRLELKAAEQRRDALKEDLDAAKEHRDALRDAARSLSDSIASRFAPDSDFGEGTTLSSLTTDLQRKANLAGQFGFAADRLKQLGLDGPALQYLLENASGLQLQQFANQGPEALDAFEAQFNATNQSAQLAGQTGANAVLREELAKANALAAEARDLYREQVQITKRIEKRQEKYEQRMEGLAEDAPKDTAKALGPVISGAALQGMKGQAPK